MPTVRSAQPIFFLRRYHTHPAYPATPPNGVGRGGHTRQVSQPNSEPYTPNRTLNRAPNRGRGRGFRGRGRGHPEMLYRSRYSEFGIGASLNGRGRGGGMQKLRPDAPLTSLLYQERPLLRPIVFVPSVLNPTLFDQDETLLKPGVEEIGMFSYLFFPIQTGQTEL